jgi:threonine/homoserine/homoserine lactone efflux protein
MTDRLLTFALAALLLAMLPGPVFAVALYPQFIPDGGPVAPWLLALAAIQVTLSCAWYALLALAVDRARRLLGRPSVRRRLEQASGAVLVALGVRVAPHQR